MAGPEPEIGLRDLAVAWRPIASLRPYARNARTHSKKQIQEIAYSITAFGWTNPVLVDQDLGLIAGHARVEAAKLLGLDQVPTIAIDDLTPTQKRAYIIADNKLALNAGWDEQILAEELQDLLVEDEAFDISLTGFAVPEVDSLIEGLVPVEDHDPRDDAQPGDGPPVSKIGDIWDLGPHRVICGDALKVETFRALMGIEQARMVFTDPPYNVPIQGNVGGSGAIQHREFVMASGEMSVTAFTGFLQNAFGHLATFSCSGSIHFVCMDWRHMGEVLVAGRASYQELKNLIVWVKDNGGMGSFYRSKHELIFAFKKGTAAHINSFELGQHGRNRTNVWHYRGVNTFRANRLAELALHPTVKPVALIADAIKDVSKRGDLVLDAFGGSGSTLIAAEKTKRRARLIELDPVYVDTIVRRWQAFTHDHAVHAETGKTFTEMAQERADTQSTGGNCND